jgi:hypothetical protein
MSNNKQSSVDELCNSFYEESIDESNIPREHYEYEIKQLMIEFALYYEQTYKKNMMTNDKQSSVLWLVSKIDFMLPTYLIEQAKAMHKEETEAKYQEGREIGKIEVLTSQSTKNASEYSQGYNKGFLAALEYMNSTIDNKIKLRKYEQ